MIYFLAPLPPPVHGFSAINQKMLAHIQTVGRVRIFDRVPRRAGFLSNPIVYVLLLFVKFASLFLVERPRSLYVGLSGGKGQLADLIFIFFAKLFNIDVFVHHHSFAYINECSAFYRFTLWFLKDCYNIVLCKSMGDALVELYKFDLGKICVLSNAAFLTAPIEKQANKTPNFVIGFLSNITEEKGIFDYFSVLEILQNEGIDCKGIVAGPVDPIIKSRFDNVLSSLQNVSHIGPVYGDLKTQFFANINLLLFPTKYPNEAEPVTILEAFSAGVPVIAAGRGCIASLFPVGASGVVDHQAYVIHAVSEIKLMINSNEYLVRCSENSRSQFDQLQEFNLDKLNEIVLLMARK